MAKKRNNYRLRVAGKLVNVSEDVYNAYYQTLRRERYLEESDVLHGKVLYSALDTDELNGEEMLPDAAAVSIEDAVISKMLIERLRAYLPLLPEDEQSLIDALFFSNSGQGMSEREYAAISGIPRKTIAYRRAAVLDKLKNFLES